ncbi:MAG: ribosome maturation factor RimM [Armatimonadota bacterium]|nr:ribosome maturation factor RimM [Armatimonadota bacterium]
MGSSSRSARGRPAGAPPAPPAWIVVGRIVRPHGVRGEVRVRPETDFPERLAGRRRVHLRREGALSPVEITGVRPHGAALLVTLRGVDSLEAAERLRGAELVVARRTLPRLGPNEFYLFEIIGLRARTEDGRLLGVVAEVVRGPAHDVYVVRGEAGEVLVPALREVVRQVDRAAGELVVRLPAGLEA